MSSAYRPQRAEQNPFHIYAVGDSPFQSSYTPQAFPGELPSRPTKPKKASNNVVMTSRFAPNLKRSAKSQNKAWIVVSALLITLFSLILAPNFINMPALQPQATENAALMSPPHIPKLKDKSARAYMVRQPQIRTRTVRAVTYDTLSIPFSWFSSQAKISKPTSQASSQATFISAPIINGILTSPFGQRWRHRHQGIDIAAPFGTPIYSAADGKVVYSGWVGGYGQSVLIDHGKGYKTRYAHCSKLLVRKGQRVKNGQAIALVGSTGHSTGPHLHLEVLFHGVRKNPGRFFRLTPPFSPLSQK